MAIESAGAEGRPWLLPKPTMVALALSLARLVVIGLVAIGASGAVAAGLGALFGRSFVAGDLPGVTYTRERCADFLEYEPGAPTCEQAAAAHHFGEVVTYRLAAGVLGVLLFLPYLWVRRRFREIDQSGLPRGFEATVGVSIFGIAAAGLLASSLDGFFAGGSAGVGEYLSGAIVAAAVAAVYGLSLYRTLLASIGRAASSDAGD
jgi:hypothetical protein